MDRGLLNRLDDFGMRMAENGRPPGADIVHVLVAIHVKDAGAPRAIHEKRPAPHRAKRPDRRIHPAGDAAQRFHKQPFRFNP